jgi:predicted transporter
LSCLYPLSGGENEVSNLQKILMTIMTVLVFLSLLLCGIAYFYLRHNGEEVKPALSFTVVLLVASIPIAIEIVSRLGDVSRWGLYVMSICCQVCTTTLALGSKELSKKGAIVSRLAAIEDLAGACLVSEIYHGWALADRLIRAVLDRHEHAVLRQDGHADAEQDGDPGRDACLR